MDPELFNKKVWEATIEAQFKLAGMRGFDPKTQSFLIPSGGIQTNFPGLSNPSNTKEVANLNSQLYSLADQMPSPDAVQWAPASNRRYANYGTYLDVSTSRAVSSLFQEPSRVVRCSNRGSLNIGSPETCLCALETHFYATVADVSCF